MQKNYTPLAVAMITTNRLLNRRPWNDFKNKTSYMNLKIPFGMPLHEALLRSGKHVGKCLIVRNLFKRPFFKLWQYKIIQIQEKELQDKMMKKIFFRNSHKNHQIIHKLWPYICYS